MITKDLNIFESGDGGELSIINEDLLFGESLYQQIYLALFGGNVEENTRQYLITEQRNDYWGNSLFFGEIPSKQFNSNTERMIKNIVLNSSGRLDLIRAINEDLTYLRELLNYFVDVRFESFNKIRMIIKFEPKSNQQSRALELVYDNAKNDLIIDKII